MAGSTLAADSHFAGPFEGRMLFVAVDAHFKWPEVCLMDSTTASKTIQVLKSMFSRYGLPEVLVSDNGPQFVLDEFARFLKANGVKHMRSAPFHPATNGLAERFVQTLKHSLRSSRGSTSLQERPQYVRVKDRVSDTVLDSTGEPLGTVQAPFLFTLYTADFTHTTTACHLQKFSDDSAIVGCILDGDESDNREVTGNYVDRCQQNFLHINTGKTKELVPNTDLSVLLEYGLTTIFSNTESFSKRRLTEGWDRRTRGFLTDLEPTVIKNSDTDGPVELIICVDTGRHQCNLPSSCPGPPPGGTRARFMASLKRSPSPTEDSASEQQPRKRRPHSESENPADDEAESAEGSNSVDSTLTTTDHPATVDSTLTTTDHPATVEKM
ncbi:hypothetical protein NFI96_019149, partial [Prochilodus magdalenae]